MSASRISNIDIFSMCLRVACAGECGAHLSKNKHIQGVNIELKGMRRVRVYDKRVREVHCQVGKKFLTQRGALPSPFFLV